MGKMFYTLEEAAAKLNKSEDEVREMASSGQIQEFRDRDKLMFKVEQIDLLAGDDASDDIGLAIDEGDSLGLDIDGAADSGLGLAADTGSGSAITLEPLDGSGDGSGLGSGLGL